MVDRIYIGGVICVGLVCGSCGATHAIPAVKYDSALEEGGFWTCPNGHSRGYDKSASERAAEKRATDRIKQENARLTEEVAQAERDRLKAERALTKHKKRAAAGVCPCCNRTVAQMAKHMRSKHPEYSGDTNVVAIRK